MSVAREKVLARLRSAQVDNEWKLPDLDAIVRGRNSQTRNQLVNRLQRELEKAHAEVFYTTPGEWGKSLGSVDIRAGRQMPFGFSYQKLVHFQ